MIVIQFQQEYMKWHELVEGLQNEEVIIIFNQKFKFKGNESVHYHTHISATREDENSLQLKLRK